MHNRDLSLDEYGISRWEYKELLAFCRQYDEKRARAADLLYRTTGNLSCMPRGSNTSDPVCVSVARRERLLHDCEMIEQAAIAADPENYKAIIRNVTKGAPYEACKFYGARATFFRTRRKFFFLLRNRKYETFGT